MRLTRYTDYALRVLLHLAVNTGRPVPISEIAGAYGISQNHLVKVVHDMVKSGLLESTRGRSGGVALARPAEEIRLGQVVLDSEPDMKLVDCDDCAIARVCGLPLPLQEATRAFIEVLDRYTVADMVASSPGLGRALSSV